MKKKKFILALTTILICLILLVSCSEETLDQNQDNGVIISANAEPSILEIMPGFWQVEFIVEDGVDVSYIDYGIGFEVFSDGTMHNYISFERFNEEPFTYTATADMQILLSEGIDGSEYYVNFYYENIDGIDYLVWEDATIVMKLFGVDRESFLEQAPTQ